MYARGWIDALVIAYVLAMFIRTYDVELFKIPTGSMTPTLVGDDAAVEMDYDGNGEKDLVLLLSNTVLHVFLKEDGKYTRQLWVNRAPVSLMRQVKDQARPRHDMILVNKFCYWFSPPKRGDILVFKVPDRPWLDRTGDRTRSNPWDPTKPIFIKRCVGLPGDRILLEPPSLDMVPPGSARHLGKNSGTEIQISAGPAIVNGEQLESPEVFDRIDHFPYGFSAWNLHVGTQAYEVPNDGLFMMGDNSSSSADSRAWGDVPLENVKGKAIFRYWPLKKISFLE